MFQNNFRKISNLFNCSNKSQEKLKETNQTEIKIIGINYKDNKNNAIKWLEELGNPYSDIAVDKESPSNLKS